MIFVFFFFFQAEDGIRDLTVTGVQTCALPISRAGPPRLRSGSTPASAFAACRGSCRPARPARAPAPEPGPPARGACAVAAATGGRGGRGRTVRRGRGGGERAVRRGHAGTRRGVRCR